MKKLMVVIFFVGAGLLSFVPVQTQTNEMDNLQKQVTSLKNNNTKLEGRLKQLMKTSAGLKDTLQTQSSETNNKIKVLSDTLVAKDAQIKLLKMDLENSKINIHSIAVSNTIQYIFFVVVLILILAVYFILMRKVGQNDEENQERLVKAKDELNIQASKANELLRSEISESKESILNKINDFDKKLSALKVKD